MKTYSRRQMIEDISVLEDGRMIRICDPDHGDNAEWNPDTKEWGPVRPGTNLGEYMDGRDLNASEIRALAEAGAVPAR